MKKIEEETIQSIGELLGFGAEIVTATALGKMFDESDVKKSLVIKLGACLASASVCTLTGVLVKKGVDDICSTYNSIVDAVEKTKVDIVKSEMSRED